MNVRNLWYLILLKIKTVALFSIVGAVALAGLYYVQNKDNTSEQEAYATQLSYYNTQVNLCNENITNVQQQIEDLKAYKENSIIMNIDPYDEVFTTGYVYIVPTDPEKTAADYANMVAGSVTGNGAFDYLESVATAHGTELRYLQELITYAVKDGGSVLINITGNDVELNEAIYAAIVEQVETVSEEYADLFTCSITDVVTARRVDNNIVTKQSNYNTQLQAFNQVITTQRTTLKNLVAPSAPQSLKVKVIKGGVFGFILGFIAVFVVIVIVYMIKQAVQNEADITSYVGEKNLGSFSKDLLKGKKAKLLTRHVMKKLGWVNDESTEETVNMVATNIANYSGDSRKLVAIGKVSEKIDTEKLRSEIEARLKKRNADFTLTLAPDAMTSAEEREVLAKSDAAIILVEKNGTNVEAAQSEKQILTDLKKECIGVILL